jgi:hypothetical protein
VDSLNVGNAPRCFSTQPSDSGSACDDNIGQRQRDLARS